MSGRSTTKAAEAPAVPDGLLTYADLAGRWRVGLKQARRIVVKRRIAKLEFGHRTVRFRPADVDRAEAAAAGMASRARFEIR